jgi:transposase-like protein
MSAVLTAKHFRNEAAAYKWVETRLWAAGRACPHCGVVGDSGALKGKSTRMGVYKCYSCRKPFTVKVGTIFESSHVKLHLWLQAMHLMAASKKGFSTNQLHRTLGVSIQTAWFMSHRIRMAMAPAPGSLPPLGGEGQVVEADETYYGKVERPSALRKDGKPFMADRPNRGSKRGGRGPANKRPIVALVERGGQARTFHVAAADSATIGKIVRENVVKASRLHTDESNLYPRVGKTLAAHETVKHSAGEYVRYEEDGVVHSNSAESYFSVFKRGMRGIYQHCAEKHLHRYLAEFDFRHNQRAALGVNDRERADKLLAGVTGKRLTYKAADRPA